MSDRTIGRWRDEAYLFWELPGVYAVGHPGRSTESDLAAALLYAGPGAMLSHGTAVWWLELLKYAPREIHVSSPRRVMDHGNIVVHGRRTIDRIWHNSLPVTTPSQAIVDFATTDQPDLLRLVLANADFQQLLDITTLQASIGQGARGTRALREALEIHLPQLAFTRSRAERVLLILCQRGGVRLPDDVNVLVRGFLVDAVWHDLMLIVEIDGTRGHKTPAQVGRDHQRDLELRAAGYTDLRYTETQLEQYPEAILTELRRYL